MLWQIVLVLFITWLLVEQLKRRKLHKVASQIPSLSKIAIPFIGHTYLFIGNDEDRMNQLKMIGREAIQNGGCVGAWFGRRLEFVIAEPVVCELVLRCCLQKDDAMKLVQDYTGNGLIFADKNIWRPRRKIMAPTFSPKMLSQFTEVFSRLSTQMVHHMKNVSDKGEFSVWKYLNAYSMDAVCETNLGVMLNVQSNPNHPFLQAFDQTCMVIATRIVQPWLHCGSIFRLTSLYRTMQQASKVGYGFIDEFIQQKRESMKEEMTSTIIRKDENSKFKTFLEMLIENSGGSSGYTNLELREEIMVLTLAGTDTSAVGSCFTLMMLAKYQEIQEKVFKELKAVFGDSERQLTNDDLPKLKYLEAVVKESLRLYPPVPVIVRKTESDFTLPNGITLPPDVAFLIHIWAIHRNPEYWGENAEIFDPERFFDKSLSHPAAFIPFSHGPRNCLGYNYALMSIKVAVSAVIRKYRVLPATTSFNFAPQVGGDKKADENARVKFDIMMKDIDNFMIKIEERIKN